MADKAEFKELDGQSKDITAAEKEKLKAIFPECFSEGKLDIDKLLSLCGEFIDNDFEKYKFEWKGKSECYRIAAKRSTGTLRPVPEESVDFDKTNNLYIEGDNLEVLKLLQSAYYRKVKMIYIDPPYNTGNDFVYEDDFKDPMAKYKEITSQTTKSNPETMGRYHTNWLNMMYPRLRLAANLLRDDGVIFISIDDNEVTNLRRLCDEVFGEENFVAKMIWQKKTGASDAINIATITEYILVYAKKVEQLKLTQNTEAHDKKRYKYNDEYIEQRGSFYYDSLDRGTLGYHDSLDFAIKAPDGVDVYPNGRNKKLNDGWRWKWGKEKVKWGIENGFIEVRKNNTKNGGWGVYYKIYENVDNDGNIIQRSSPYKNLLQNVLNTHASTEAKELFERTDYFSNPKPIELIKHFVLLGSKKDDIILDFFSGSATTAHAVMQLNAEDGGNRQFIMVQLPEITDEKSEAYKAGYKNICEIGKERIRRAGKKYLQNAGVDIKKEETKRALNLTGQPEELLKLGMVSSYNTGNGSEATYKNGFVETLTQNGVPQPLVDVGFKVFKLDTSNLVKWDDTPIDANAEDAQAELFARFDAMNKSLKADRSDLDVIFEVMLKLGIPLTYSINEITVGSRKVYSIGDDGLVLVCLDSSNGGITPEDIEAMCELAPAKIIASKEAFVDEMSMPNAHYISKDYGVEIELL